MRFEASINVSARRIFSPEFRRTDFPSSAFVPSNRTTMGILDFCFSQASGLSLYGAGERIGKEDVSAVGLGCGTFFSGNKYGISFSSPSSLWKSSVTRFTIHSGLNYLKIPSFSDQFQHNLPRFSFLF